MMFNFMFVTDEHVTVDTVTVRVIKCDKVLGLNMDK